MPKWPKLPSKAALGERFADYPLLNAIVRMLVYEPLFRIAFVGLLILAVAIAGFVAKTWTASPPGFSPVVKLSALDYIQAWSLARTARKAAAKGRLDDALYSWRLAIANNPAEPKLLRECLATLSEADHRLYTSSAINYCQWLLRLSGTNRSDLELTANLYQRFGLDDLMIYNLAPFENDLSAELEALYLPALFERNQFTRFAERWEDARRRGVKLPGAELPLYHAAYEAGWGSKTTETQQQLDAAKENPVLRVLAHRLQLKVSERLVQPDVYRRSLEFLTDWRRDRLADRIAYWRLLAAVGRQDEALKLIEAHAQPPTSGEETVLLAKAYFDFDKPDTSRDILRKYAPEFSDSEAVWISYANLLIAQKRWDDLRVVALLVRDEDNPLRDPLAAFSYYIGGVAEVGQGRRSSAESAFKRIADAPVKDALWQLAFAEKIEGWGFAEAAQEILLRIKKTAPDDSRYWVLLAKTAFEQKDAELLVSALTGAYRLRPNDPMIVNNYAAGLIATRQRPLESLRLTARVLEKNPGEPGALLNHALSLLQNRRLEEAEKILAGLDPTRLTGANFTSYQFARFELCFDQRRYDEARRAFGLIDAKHLLPTEKQWLERARTRMSELAGSDS